MKPDFALILTHDSVSLLQRGASGWARIGDVALDAPDGAATLTELREQIHALPGDHGCKLVIPDDQIKYLSLVTDGDPDEAVRAALADATPYAVDELEYDWTAEGGVIHAAAVALETLAEAEDFAVKHGFEPVCFAAIPDSADFQGEPFFGTTRWAAEALPEGTIVERDDSPISISDEVLPAEGTDAAASEPAPVAAMAARAVAEAGPAPEHSAADSKSLAPTAPALAEEAESIPAQEQPEQPTPEQPVAASAATLDKASAAPAEVSAAPALRASRSDDIGPAKAPLAAAAPERTTATKKESITPTPPLPSPASAPISDPALLAGLAANLKPDPEARLDRDQIAVADSATAAKAPQAAMSAPPKRPAAASHQHEKQRMTTFGARKNNTRRKPRFMGLILTAILLLFLVGVAAWASMLLDDGLARFLGRGDDIKLANLPTGEVSPEVMQPQDQPDAATPASTDTSTSTREIEPLPGYSPRQKVAVLPEERSTPLSPSEAKAHYAATGIWQMAPAAPDVPSDGAPLADIYEASPDPGISLSAPEPLPQRTTEVQDTRPSTPSTPPPAGKRFDLDERGLVRATPAGALTPEGVRVFTGRPALTPPAKMAQTATASEDPASPAIAEPPADTPEETESANLDSNDKALASKRPQLRPERIVAQAEAAQAQLAAADDAGSDTASEEAPGTLAFGSNPALAALTPRMRPATLASAAAESATAPLPGGVALNLTTADSANAASEPEALDDAAFDNATDQAVTASLTPLRRPEDFITNVRRSQERATAQPQAQPQQTQPQQAQPQSKPAPAAPQMQAAIPSNASVSEQATARNVLNLREVNLIGVYGSSANRRALVRLGNGRYQKVSVGDTLDGGQVAAIGEAELHYVKRGRKMVLRMPQG